MTNRQNNTLLLGVAGLITCFTAQSTTLNWPTETGACASSLQACINSAAAGDIIEILGSFNSLGIRNSFNEVRESISIERPIALRGSANTEVIFTEPGGITIDLPTTTPGGSVLVELNKLNFIRNSIVVTDNSPPGTSVTYVLTNLNFVGASTNPVHSSLYIATPNPSFPTTQSNGYIVTNNTFDLQNDTNDSGAIYIANRSIFGTYLPVLNEIVITGNQLIRRASPSASATSNHGIAIYTTNTSITRSPFQTITLANNYISGPFFNPIRAVIDRIELAGTSEPALMRVAAYNNMIVGAESGIEPSHAMTIQNTNSLLNLSLTNNTIAFNNTGALKLEETGTTSPSLNLYNNLIASNLDGIILTGAITTNDSHNLFFRTGAHINFTPNTLGLITADPLLESTALAAPSSLLSGLTTPLSPAINSGINAQVYDSLDMTKESRIVGGRVDIGAVEISFDKSYRVTANSANIDSSGQLLNISTSVPSVIGPLRNSEIIVATPVSSGFTGALQSFGVFQQGSSNDWFIFHQPTQLLPSPYPLPSMQAGEQYHVFVPYINNTSTTGIAKYGYRHTTQCTVSCGSDIYSNLSAGRGSSMLPDYLTNQPNVIAAITPRYENASGTSPSTNFQQAFTGIEYVRSNVFGSPISFWAVVNQDDTPLPQNTMDNRSFNTVVAQGGLPNAFRVIASVAFPASLNRIKLDHPLLNDNPCATPVATLNNSLSTPPLLGDYLFTRLNVPFVLEYQYPARYGAKGYWYVRTPGNTFQTAGFNIILDGLQATRCLSEKAALDMFSDGFE